MSKQKDQEPDNLPQWKSREFTPEVLKEQALKDEAYRMRMAGNSFAEIAKALDIDGGWKAAYRIIAAEYGELVARLKVNDIRVQEAGRLMEMRAGIENLARQGEQWAVDADLKMTRQIAELLGLPAASEAVSAGAGSGPNVQINISPPWEQRGGVVDVQNDDGPAPDTIEGEAVEEGEEFPGG
jgi:hypothetical protein